MYRGLSLGGLTTLSPEVAKALAGVKEKHLLLNAPTTISGEAAGIVLVGGNDVVLRVGWADRAMCYFSGPKTFTWARCNGTRTVSGSPIVM